MKKTYIFLFIILLSVLALGCEKKQTTGVENDNNLNSSEMENYVKISNVNCPELNVAKEVSKNYFVGQDGYLYEYSLNELFSSTNKNCSIVDTNGKYMKGFSGGLVYDEDDYGYILEDIKYDKNIFTIEKSYEHEKNREYFIKKSFPNSKLQLFLITDFGIIVEDNKIYDVRFDLGGGSSEKKVINFDYTNEILNIYETQHSYEAFYVETNNLYFACKKEIINNQECEIYADIECKKEYVCKVINDFKNVKVKNFLGDIVILENGDICQNSTLFTS